MANLKEIRNRIASVQSTRQITSAMKMVSAAKLRKAQDAILQLRPYAQKLHELLQNLSQGISAEESPYVEVRDKKNILLVPISSNKGLCGGFNSQVIKATLGEVEHYSGANVKVAPIGKKADDFFKKQATLYAPLPLPENADLAKPSDIFDKLTFQHSEVLAEALMQAFVSRQFDSVVLIYNQFKNAATQVLCVEEFLPLVPSSSKSNSIEYIFEPSKEEIVIDLIPRALRLKVYKALRDSFAAEHGARMTAMHKATDNASELIKTLRLHYNKARQAAITGEILEIVAGAEALK